MRCALLMLLLLTSVVAACAPTTGALPVELSPGEVSERMRAGAVVVDVRELDEWMVDGHIDGTVHIPLGQLSERAGELNADDEIIVLCRTGNRSKTALALLRELGFSDLHELRGGIRAWMAEGMPVVYGR